MKKKATKVRVTSQRAYLLVEEVEGEDALKVVKYLYDKKNISEFNIAAKLKMEVQKVRNVLYRLHSHNLVTYHKKKDREKGWYISYWTFNRPYVNDLISKRNIEKLQKLKERLEREQQNKTGFFSCPNNCMRLDFEKSTEFGYRCPECGALLEQHDNSELIVDLKKNILRLEKETKSDA